MDSAPNLPEPSEKQIHILHYLILLMLISFPAAVLAAQDPGEMGRFEAPGRPDVLHASSRNLSMPGYLLPGEVIQDTIPRNGVPADTIPQDDAPPDTLPPLDEPGFEFEETEAEEIIPVTPMSQPGLPAWQTAVTDSLLRWELWSNPAERHSRQRGVISYRLGTLGRNDGLILDGHEERHRKVFFRGIPFNDRVTGSMNTNRMPHHRFSRVYERRSSLRHETDFKFRRYYVLQPLTSISYEQSANNYRSTEGFFTRNLDRQTNVELFYWGKNEDEDYRNNSFSGRKAGGNVFRHFSDRMVGEGGILYNGLQLGEPGGFQIPDMNFFGFQPINTVPLSPQAHSSVRQTMVHATFWARPDTLSDMNTQVTGWLDQYRRFYFGGIDSTYFSTATAGVLANRWLQAGPVSLRVSARADRSSVDRESNRALTRTSWSTYEGRAEGEWRMAGNTFLQGWTRLTYRSDDFLDFELGGKIRISPVPWFSAHAAVAAGEHMPSIQQLYWNSAWQGNPGLGSERMERLEAGFRISPMYGLWMGATAYRKDISSPVFMGQDSVFTQTEGYQSDGADLFAEFDSGSIEAGISLTYQNFGTESLHFLDQQLATGGSRVWTRVSAFYKDYVFDRAAFVKIGGYYMISGNPYRTGTYFPSLDYWDSNSFEQHIPMFQRLDLELSARVRSVMVFTRLEDALNEITHFGYFETALHPMPGRRFRFGVKWILRN